MRKRPVSIAILLLVLGFVLLYYTMQKPVSYTHLTLPTIA